MNDQKTSDAVRTLRGVIKSAYRSREAGQSQRHDDSAKRADIVQIAVRQSRERIHAAKDGVSETMECMIWVGQEDLRACS